MIIPPILLSNSIKYMSLSNQVLKSYESFYEYLGMASCSFRVRIYEYQDDLCSFNLYLGLGFMNIKDDLCSFNLYLCLGFMNIKMICAALTYIWV